MKKVIVLLALSLVAAIAFSATAMAYDHLITNDTAAIKETGKMTAGASLLFLTAKNAWDADGEKADEDWDDSATKLYIPLLFRYGIMDKLEAFAILPYEKWDQGDFGESGIGDLWLGAKYGLMPEGKLTLRGALDIPLGDDEKGLGQAGGFGIDIAAMTTKQIDKIGLDGQVGIRYNAEDSDTKIQPGLGIYLDGEGSYDITEAIAAQLGLELMFVGDGKLDGEDWKDSGSNLIELNIGGMYKLAENMGLKGDILYTITGKNTNCNMGVLIKYCYSF